VSENALYYGDNLDVLRRHISDKSVDLVYLDPPFNSNASYNVLFGHADGTQAAAQIKAFDDTWHWDQAASAAFHEVVTQGGEAANALAAFQTMLGPSTMLAYLSMMAPRLIELRRVLKDTGTLYLHCDPTASHYLKLLLDAVFGPKNFRNEIIWCYAGGGIPRKDFPRKHDTILRYTKSADYYYAPVYRPYSEGTQQRGRTRIKGKYFDQGLRPEGTPVNDWWSDVPKITSPTDPEKLSYPTQKPEALLTRIIAASCPAEGIILDPFCGCGTTIAAAETLKHSWIGIDITYLAVSLIKSRLTKLGTANYLVLGEPTTLDDAAQLAKDDPHQFQWWALGHIGARPAVGKKGADRGIDGRLYFFDEASEMPKQLIASVKGGAVKVDHVRDLSGVVQREQAQLGVFISLLEPTQPMREEAASAGFYTSPWGTHPRIQLFTIAELLDGKRVDMPAGGAHMMQVALPPTPEPTVHPDQLSLGD
jgi:DNA modification methylase